MKTVVNHTCVRCWSRWMTCGKVQVSCIYGQSLQIALSISLMLGCVCWNFWAESGAGYLKVIDNDQNMLPILDNIPFPSICPIYEIWTKYGTVPSQSMSMNNISIFRNFHIPGFGPGDIVVSNENAKTQPRFGSPQAPEPQDLDVPREVPGFREGLGRTPGRSSQEDPQPAEKGALLTSPLWLKPPMT